MIESKWHKIRDAIYNCATSAYGKKEHKNADWVEACWDDMEPVIEAKRQKNKALLTYNKSSNQTSLEALRTSRRDAQLTARRCANSYWLSLCKSIQDAADTEEREKNV